MSKERSAVVELSSVGVIASRLVGLPLAVEKRLGGAVKEWGDVAALSPTASGLPVPGSFSVPGRGRAGARIRKRNEKKKKEATWVNR